MLLNKNATRDYILKRWKEQRPGHEITQVSASALAYFERKLEESIDFQIHCHPSIGKTFKVG
jgi:hypothetical protein